MHIGVWLSGVSCRLILQPLDHLQMKYWYFSKKNYAWKVFPKSSTCQVINTFPKVKNRQCRWFRRLDTPIEMKGLHISRITYTSFRTNFLDELAPDQSGISHSESRRIPHIILTLYQPPPVIRDKERGPATAKHSAWFPNRSTVKIDRANGTGAS